MKVALAGGTGNVGVTLASKLAAKGHTILLGSTNPTSEKATSAIETVKAENPGAAVEARSNADACRLADVIILTFPSAYTTSSISAFAEQLGDVTGKVILDATNPFGPRFALEFEGIRSAGEAFSAALPKAHVYKAFNTIGVAHMKEPLFHGKPIDMLFAGPTEQLALVERVISDVGFHPRHVGPIEASKNLEYLAELWVHMSYKYGTGKGGAFGFTVLEK